MKLGYFSKHDFNSPRFGMVIQNQIGFFQDLELNNAQKGLLSGMKSYLENLPESFELARDLSKNFSKNNLNLLEDVKIHPPLPKPAMLIDFGLTPKHLINSGKTLLCREFGKLPGSVINYFVSRKILKRSKSADLLYYKGNHTTIIGHADTIHWPDYTEYLDIEPELAFVTGNEKQPIGGYLIFNDSSARDVQFPEMIGTGPARSKDFPKSKGIGPFLVTPDEISDPLNLKVEVQIGNRLKWFGNTNEYTTHPEKVMNYLTTIFTPPSGTIIGMGTAPNCTCLDNDVWILPGEEIRITFENIGTLIQNIPSNIPKIKKRRWKKRNDLGLCHV